MVPVRVKVLDREVAEEGTKEAVIVLADTVYALNVAPKFNINRVLNALHLNALIAEIL